MRKVAFVLIAALVAVGCDDDDDEVIIDVDADGIPDDIDDDIVVPTNEFVWDATITGTGVFANLVGDATVVQVEGESAFDAMVTLRNDVVGAVRPWHVHFGTCGTGGGIVGADAAYPRLVIGSDGAATEAVLIRTGLDPAAAYHVNIHESDANFNNIIACGDLVLQ